MEGPGPKLSRRRSRPLLLDLGGCPAVRNCRIVEIKSALILQPGPAALTDGLDAILAALGHGK
jgi:iron complex transport system substrate-binding protein